MHILRNNLASIVVRARILGAGTALGTCLVALLAGCGGTPGMSVCTDSITPMASGEFCAPATIAAGQTLRLQIREQCGGCTQKSIRCEVVVQGQDIKLRLLGQTCTLPPDTACPAICSVSTFDCAVPPLAAGIYQVSSAAGSTKVITMTADPTVSATGCTVPPF